MRTKACKLIGRVKCEEVAHIIMEPDENRPFVRLLPQGGLPINLLDPTEFDAFARRDGFEDWIDLCEFWCDQHPEVLTFYGVLIRWDAEHFKRQR